MGKLKQFFTDIDLVHIGATLVATTIVLGIFLPTVALVVVLAWKMLISVILW